jgi:predicted NUDIX family NTP pyrophosphohydrolase
MMYLRPTSRFSTTCTRQVPGRELQDLALLTEAKCDEKKSAGLLPFRETALGVEVLLVHPGGPFWANKDDGSWSIPKGKFADDEEPLAAAKREFEEETGAPPAGGIIPLEPLKQPNGKLVFAWVLRSDFDPSSVLSLKLVE